MISGTDLRRFGIQSVEEAIRYLGHGMTSYEFDNRLNAAFGARGYLSDNLGLHIAVLIDGNQAGGSSKTARGTQQYLMPIELVDHIEVVIGPGSVVYGNSAMLGVINVVTRSASSIEGVNLVAQGSAGTAADKWAKNASWGEVWGRSAAYGATRFMVGGDPFELVWHGAVRWDRQQGRAIWRSIDGADLFADPLGSYTREDVFNRDLGGKLFAKANWRKWTFLGWAALSGGTGVGPIEASGNSNYLEPEFGLDAKWESPVWSRGNLSLRTYAVIFDSRVNTLPVNVDTQHCLDAVGTSRCTDTIRYTTIKPFFEPIFAWDWNQDGSHVSTLGAQIFIDGSVITTGSAALGGSRTVNDVPLLVPLPNAALYAQHIWRAQFGSLNLGVRGDLGFIGSAISPRAAFNRKIGDDGTLKLIFSTGFRTPVITEKYLEIPHFLTGNDNIKPEHVYSAEVDYGQRFGAQNVELSFFGTFWDQLITVRGVNVNGESLNQFQNAHKVWSAGVNAGWQGQSGPLDWGLSLNYAPGRRQLPGDIAQFSDQELSDLRVQREAINRYGWHAFGYTFLPADAMPDAYGTGHISVSLGEALPRLSVAAQLSSPRTRGNWANNGTLLDPRNVDGPWLPWSVDARAAVEQQLSDRVGLRFTFTARSIATVASPTRVGDLTGPVPEGGIGTIRDPVAPLSAMAEVNVRL
ncbi:MAG: TonB-dependent receptor plug domain-containing protein [Myxococcaceae bacterium]